MTAPASPATAELVHELRRQEENCSYSAASLYLWFKFLRMFKACALTLQVVLGALATWKVLTKDYTLLTAVFALGASVIAPLLSAMKVSDEIAAAKAAAGEFTALRDRFRRAALVDSQKPFDEFESVVNELFDRMDKARMDSTAPPEPFFWLAQRKTRSGHFEHDYDQQRKP
jgi:small-conductance mechanosensitive channel